MRAKDAMAKSEAALKANTVRNRTSIRRAGWPGMTPKMLIGEFVVELVQALIAAALLRPRTADSKAAAISAWTSSTTNSPISIFGVMPGQPARR